MNLSKHTNLTKQAVLFTDGAGGSFSQQHTLHADGEDLGITMHVSGSNTQKATRVFVAAGQEFKKFKNAAIAAGHTWEKIDDIDD